MYYVILSNYYKSMFAGPTEILFLLWRRLPALSTQRYVFEFFLSSQLTEFE